MSKFTTTSAYVSGAICGSLWMPPVLAGTPFRGDIRRQLDRYSDARSTSFRTVLLSMLRENGGDFQNAEFTADTVVRVERRRMDAHGYTTRVWEREIRSLPDCDDLVAEDTYVGDFEGEMA